MNHSNVTGRALPSSVVYNRISLWTRDATGGEDLVVLVHTEGFPTQVLHGQAMTVTQHLISSLHTTMKPLQDFVKRSGLVSSNSRVNHSFKIQNSCNQFGSKPAQMTGQQRGIELCRMIRMMLKSVLVKFYCKPFYIYHIQRI